MKKETNWAITKASSSADSTTTRGSRWQLPCYSDWTCRHLKHGWEMGHSTGNSPITGPLITVLLFSHSDSQNMQYRPSFPPPPSSQRGWGQPGEKLWAEGMRTNMWGGGGGVQMYSGTERVCSPIKFEKHCTTTLIIKLFYCRYFDLLFFAISLFSTSYYYRYSDLLFFVISLFINVCS